MKMFNRRKNKPAFPDPQLLTDIALYLSENELTYPFDEELCEYDAVVENTASFPADAFMAQSAPSQPVSEQTGHHGIMHVPKASSAGRKASEAIPSESELDHILEHEEETFQSSLFRMIDRKELKDSVVYKRAGIDRRHFSKIRSNPDYSPKKQTALAFCFALELNLDESVDLLKRAGYALSPSNRADLIARYCIEHEIWDLGKVNELLFYYDQPLLGGV